jgi:hypothetical protein
MPGTTIGYLPLAVDKKFGPFKDQALTAWRGLEESSTPPTMAF